jgi:presenilin-like A22 family membrane protease
MRKEVPAVTAMACLFVISIMLAMVTSYILPSEYQVFGSQNTQNIWAVVYLFGVVTVFTAIILAIAKWYKAQLIQIIILFAAGMSVLYVAYPLLLMAGLGQYAWDSIIDLAFVISAVIGSLVVLVLLKFPEWYVVDAVGVVMAGGVTAIFGISLQTSVIIIALIIFAVYDYISVFKTKHMVSLADNVMEYRLPVLLVIPKSRGYSFLKQTRLKKQLEDKSEREAMFMGLGDIVFPGMLVVSALYFLPYGYTTRIGLDGNIWVALCTLVGCLAGFLVLMRFVLKGDPQPGLPLLNGGAIAGYLISAYLTYGSFMLAVPSVGL